MNAGKYVAMWVDRGRRHGEGGGESENEFNWPLPSFSLPPETHPLFPFPESPSPAPAPGTQQDSLSLPVSGPSLLFSQA